MSALYNKRLFVVCHFLIEHRPGWEAGERGRDGERETERERERGRERDGERETGRERVRERETGRERERETVLALTCVKGVWHLCRNSMCWC